MLFFPFFYFHIFFFFPQMRFFSSAEGLKKEKKKGETMTIGNRFPVVVCMLDMFLSV